MSASESTPTTARRQTCRFSQIKIKPRPHGIGTYTSNSSSESPRQRSISKRRVTKYKDEKPPEKIQSYIKESPPKEKKKEETDNDKIEKVASQLLEGESLDIVEPKDRANVISFLKRYSSHQAQARNYVEAKIALNIIDGLQQYGNVEEKPEPDTSIEVETALAEENHDTLQQSQQEELNYFDEQTDMKRKMLVLQQKNKMDEFEEEWVHEKPRKYRKPSSTLLGYSQIEKQVALAGDYDYAQKIKDQSEAQTIKEAELAQKRLRQDYLNAKKKLKQDQAQQMKIFEDTRANQRDIIVQRHQRELNVTMKRIDVVYLRSMEKHRQAKTSANSPRRQADNAGCRILNLGQNNKTILLPELIPPNDPRMKEIEDKEKEAKNKKKEQTEKKLKQKYSVFSRYYRTEMDSKN
ncbi:hypothetical protein TVAG_351680 [Trichomonas vaginalis G3]|uniref:Uncharacterized protein n=1 Tax=Trichomonas vaginalis (strain ATCC PRA-98 / G3) TaxID=412133 RepID=A2DZQ2_TRIV3|nr:hypothetical protein TVAGG3_0261240 [Trichomonas vaginalis G3]EAY14120.1 hypothetical protein TVAG_351680 [Trichomonas vaginalis G3]KAI5525129.1 hypothetical protein TVAGG3_0261240 [Trichomonas vaginalis G3]|eukprot:XP_001326343.1 hypothetical protein [Trichomonas vaginalis G3]